MILFKKSCITSKLICRRPHLLFCRNYADEDTVKKITTLYQTPYPELIELIKKYRRELNSEEFVSTYRYRYLNHSISALKKSITAMEIKRMKRDAEVTNDLAMIPTNISLEILSNGTTHVYPSFAIKSPQRSYLFNCPENCARFLSVFRLKSSNIWDLFITRGTWRNMGGISGVLLGKEISQIPTRIHGPQRIKQYLECIRPFMDADFGKTSYPTTVDELSYEKEFYEDNILKVRYIPLFGMSKSSQQIVDVAYLVELKKCAKAIDMMKVLDLKIPKGPLIGQLKAGNSVVLPTGETITPEQVYSDASPKTEKSTLLVVEVETEEKLDSIYNNSVMQDYMGGGKKLDYIVHFTGETLFNTEKYSKWLAKFGEQCEHIVLNGSGAVLPQMENIYLHQNILNRIDPDLFPQLYPKGFNGVIRQDDNNEIRDPNSPNILRPHVLQRFPLRGQFGGEDPILLGVEDFEMEDKYQNQPKAIEELKKYQELTRAAYEKPTEERDLYPTFVFLGTSSATPNRYRNVSAYMVQLNEQSNIIIDVGEGTYGQMRILFGPEKCDEELVKLHAIFITHSHQDHMNGIFQLVENRIDAFKNLNIKYRPLIFVCNRNVKKPMNIYSRFFFDMNKFISLVDISFFGSAPATNSADSNPNSSVVTSPKSRISPIIVPNEMEQMRRVVIDITQHLPAELFRPEEWNLRSVKSVQVHHTAMSNGFVFEDFRRGRKLVFSGDTMPCDLLIENGKGADVLVHESTFGDGMENDAFRKRHCTMGQAVEVARRMAAKHVILTHFSSRYARIPPLPDYLFDEEKGNGADQPTTKNIGVAMDNMMVRFDRLSALPKILRVYREIYAENLFEISVKNSQRELINNRRMSKSSNS